MSDIPVVMRSRTREDGREPRRGLGATAVLALGTFAVGTDAFVLAGFLPATAASLRVPAALAGQAVTVFAASYALLSPVLATVTARLPRRKLLTGALLVLAAANLGSALSPDFPVLLVTRVLAAAGAAAFTPNAAAVSSAMVPPRLRARALAVVVSGLTVATALGVPLGDLAARFLGWRPALALVAGVCLAVACAIAVIMPEIPGSPRIPVRAKLAVLRRPAVLAVLPLTALGMTAAYTVYAYSIPALRAVNAGAASSAWMLGAYGAGAVAGNLASGHATDRWSAATVLTAGYAVMSAAMGIWAWMAASHTAAFPVTGLLMAAWGASSWCQTPPQQHRLIAAAPAEAPLVVALNSSAIYLGIGAGTLIGGITLPYGTARSCITAAAIAGCALVLVRLTSGRG